VVKQVLFASQAEAEKLAGLSDWIVISITGPADPPAALKEGWGDILRLSFDDIDFAQDDMRPISAEDATRLVQFVRKYADTVDGVLVHCLAGISRSAAVAKFIAEKYQLPFPDAYASYNRLVYRTLNQVLWRESYGDDIQ